MSIQPTTTTSLDAVERDALTEAETVIEAGLQTFVEVGLALVKVRDGRLYREQYGTFEEYCQRRWGLSRRRSYQLMDAANVVQEIEADVYHGTHATPPRSERQARELGRAPEGERSKVWRETQERHGSDQPPARVVRKVVQEKRKETVAERPAPKPVEVITTPTWLLDVAREVMSPDIFDARADFSSRWQGRCVVECRKGTADVERMLTALEGEETEEALWLTHGHIHGDYWREFARFATGIALSGAQHNTKSTLFYSGPHHERFRIAAGEREWLTLAPLVEVKMRDDWVRSLEIEKEVIASQLLEANRKLAEGKPPKQAKGNASASLKADYKRLSRMFHPDAGGTTEDFQALQRLYQAAEGRA